MEGRILIADDQAGSRILLRAWLGAARYDVQVAPSRADATQAAVETRPDLILVDGSAPAEAALALVAGLRDTPACAGAAIFVLLARPDPALGRAALAAGADDALPRGNDPGPLLARVRRVMRLRNGEAEFRLREETRAALGFAEGPATFETPATVALVAADPATAERWRAAIAPRLRDRVVTLLPRQILDERPGGSAAPDAYVIATSLGTGLGTRLGTGQDGLQLLAELRSRAHGRAAAVLAVTAAGDAAAQISALDLGADDVIDGPPDTGELALRLRAQLRRKARADRLRRQVSDGLRLAVTDPLTGLSNRRSALARLARLAKGGGSPLAIMVLDLDHFKQVNDSWGHGAGDAVLIEAARRLSAVLRAEDLVARLGGEEFLVAMPGTDGAAAGRAAERLRRTVEAQPFSLPGRDMSLAVTVSIGVSISGAEDETGTDMNGGPNRAETLLGMADRALYAAKAAGRNRVSFAAALS